LQLEEVHEAIDVIGHVFKRYYNLLTGNSMIRLVPAIQHNWTAIFGEPWMRPEEQ
jgi:hypothetical protein